MHNLRSLYVILTTQLLCSKFYVDIACCTHKYLTLYMTVPWVKCHTCITFLFSICGAQIALELHNFRKNYLSTAVKQHIYRAWVTHYLRMVHTLLVHTVVLFFHVDLWGFFMIYSRYFFRGFNVVNFVIHLQNFTKKTPTFLNVSTYMYIHVWPYFICRICANFTNPGVAVWHSFLLTGTLN